MIDWTPSRPSAGLPSDSLDQVGTRGVVDLPVGVHAQRRVLGAPQPEMDPVDVLVVVDRKTKRGVECPASAGTLAELGVGIVDAGGGIEHERHVCAPVTGAPDAPSSSSSRSRNVADWHAEQAACLIRRTGEPCSLKAAGYESRSTGSVPVLVWATRVIATRRG